MFHSRVVGKPASNLLKAPRLRSPVNINLSKDVNETRKQRRNKIPENIRYDLENALVGLCDVWFQDIKPYLVRNNVKVHAHYNEINAGSDAHNCSTMHRSMGAKKRSEIPGAPSCSHLDPGAAFDHHRQAAASYADCCSTRPAASRARSRKLSAPPHPPPPSLRIPPLQLSESPRNENTKKTSSKRKENKKKRHSEPAASREHRVPRLYRMIYFTSVNMNPRKYYIKVDAPSLTRQSRSRRSEID